MIELIQTPTKTLRVDIVGAFTRNLSAEQTDYAVEDGTSRTDHKILSPETLEIEIAQTETPLDDPQYSFQDISAQVALPTGSSNPSTPLDYQVPRVRTVVRSPFLLAGGALAEAGTALAGLLTDAVSNPMQTLQTSLGSTKTLQPLKQSVYMTQSPRDRGGELQDELEALLESEGDLATITYRGRTYTGMSLVGLAVSYTPGEAGLTRFSCSFKSIPIASLEFVALPNPDSLAKRPARKKGKQKNPDGSETDKTGENQETSVLAMTLGD